jgi:TonB family protein
MLQKIISCSVVIIAVIQLAGLSSAFAKSQSTEAKYYLDVLRRLRSVWAQRLGDENLIVETGIGFQGSRGVRCMGTKVLKSSGNPDVDKLAVEVLNGITFGPMPNGYCCTMQIPFKALAHPEEAAYIDEAGNTVNVFQPGELIGDKHGRIAMSNDRALAQPAFWFRKAGNISFYREDMLYRIAKRWKHPVRRGSAKVLITIASDGKLLAREIQESSGDEEFNKSVLEAVDSTPFKSLPSWYKGEKLQFLVDMDKVSQLR